MSEADLASPAEASAGPIVWRRLHSLSWVFLWGAQVRSLLVPAVLFVFADRGSIFRGMLLLVLIPAALGPLLRYLSFRYTLGDDEMVILEGVFSRNERRIPYSRIHNIDLVQNPIHRLFQVAVVRLETASGGKPEAEIRVLGLAAAAELRARVAGAAAGAGDLEEPDATGVAVRGKVLLRLPPIELVKLGLVSNRGMVLFAAGIAFLVQQTYGGFGDDKWIEATWKRLAPGVVPFVERAAGEVNWTMAGLLVIAAVLVGVVLLYLLSIALAFRFYGFTLERTGDQLRAQYGWLTRVAQSIPRGRIQCLSVVQTMIQRGFRRCAIRVDTAGGGAGGGDSFAASGGAGSLKWLAPLVDPAAVTGLLREAMPEVDPEPESWQPIEWRAWRRRFRRASIGAIVLTAVACWFTWWGLVIGAVLLPLSWVAARWYVRHRHYSLGDQALWWRVGRLRRTLTVVRFAKMQAVVLSESPFDRRHKMARLMVDTAGAGRTTHAIDVPYLDVDVARAIAARLNREIATRSFGWG